METISVYFDANHIYNLEKMSLLDIFPNQHKRTLDKHLKAIQEKYHIKLAVISFNQPLREILYSLFPQIIIIIDPECVARMMDSYLGYNLGIGNVHEEIAATVVGGDSSLDQMVQISCQDLYTYKTKKQAMTYYHTWQGYVPLGIKCFHHVIRMIDFYYDEVFNYFDFKSIIDK